MAGKKKSRPSGLAKDLELRTRSMTGILLFKEEWGTWLGSPDESEKEKLFTALLDRLPSLPEERSDHRTLLLKDLKVSLGLHPLIAANFKYDEIYCFLDKVLSATLEAAPSIDHPLTKDYKDAQDIIAAAKVFRKSVPSHIERQIQLTKAVDPTRSTNVFKLPLLYMSYFEKKFASSLKSRLGKGQMRRSLMGASGPVIKAIYKEAKILHQQHQFQVQALVLNLANTSTIAKIGGYKGKVKRGHFDYHCRRPRK